MNKKRIGRYAPDAKTEAFPLVFFSFFLIRHRGVAHLIFFFKVLRLGVALSNYFFKVLRGMVALWDFFLNVLQSAIKDVSTGFFIFFKSSSQNV